MLRRRLVVLLALGLLAPVATSAPSGGAVQPDLTLSTTSGAARTVVEVSSASCVDEPDGSRWRFLAARLVSGAPGSEVMAAAGSNGEGEPILLAVPDWIDPADPAEIVAQCWEFDPSVETPDGSIPGTSVPYDPVPFDVLDPTEAPVQSATYSRTAMSAGQGFRVDLQGCFLPGSLKAAGTELLTGSDLSGATGTGVVFADAELIGTDIDLPVLLNDSGTYLGWSVTNDERPVIEDIGEVPSSIAPGPYTAFTYCAALDGDGVTYLFFPPSPIEVTGSAPMDQIELTSAPGSRDVELAGSACTQASVEGTFGGLDIESDQGGFLRTRSSGASSPLQGSVLRPSPADRAVDADGRRAISGDQMTFTSFSAATDDQGTWSVGDVAAFDLGAVRAFATCGDPYAEGFSYDAQIAAIDVPPPAEETTTTTVTTTTAPPAPPANRVVGTPNYAG